MKLFDLKLRLIASLLALCCLVVVGSQPAQAQGPFAYVTNQFSNTVSVIDTSTNTVAATISLPGGCYGTCSPAGLAVTPDGSRVYVANQGNGTVSVIATSTNTVSATITIPGCENCASSSPTGVAITPDGTRAYVTDTSRFTIYVIDTNPLSPTYNTVTNTITSDVGNPNGPIAITPDGTAAFYTFGTGSVGRIDTSTNSHTTTITVGSTPTGIAVTPNNAFIYVTNNGGSTVSVIPNTFPTFSPITSVTVGSRPYSVAITPNGLSAYVVNQGYPNSVSVINTTTQLVVATVPPYCIFTNQIAITPDGTQAYVADNECSTADVISTASNTVTAHPTVGSGPFGVAIGPSGTTFTTPQQLITPGIPMTFTDGTIINQIVQLPGDVILNGAFYMAVNFTQVPQAVFDRNRLPATSTNLWSGGAPVPAGTTCTPIKGTGGNCVVMENLCFNSSHVSIGLCNIIAPTALIQLTSIYDILSPQPNPGLIIATDHLNDWANITDAFTTDPALSGGTKALNSDEVIVNLPPITDTSSIIRLIVDYVNAGCIVMDNDDRGHEEVHRGVANALINKLLEAQEAINAGRIQKAINILTAFKKQLQAQSGKHIATSCTIGGITFNPVTVLLTDVQSLIDHLRTSIGDPITGYVVDSSGLGISGATVRIVSTGATATTDITGFYFFPDTDDLISGSSYTVQVTALPSGFMTSTPASQTFTWSGNGLVLSNFVLTP